jgi:hypothetical protein
VQDEQPLDGHGRGGEARTLIYLRRRDDVSTGAFRKFLAEVLAPGIADTGVLKEFRTQVFMPWSERLWDTLNVAHDNPADQRPHASLMLGFADAGALRAFLAGDAVARLSTALPAFAQPCPPARCPRRSPYVKNGKILPAYEH